MKKTGRFFSVLLAILTVFGILPFSAVTAFAEAQANDLTIDFVVYNDFTGMTFEPVFVGQGQLPADALPKLPQYVTDADGQFYKSSGWCTDPACTKRYDPSPVTGSFTLYAKYVKQYLLVLYAVDPSGSELPYPDFDAYVLQPGLHGGWFDEGADVAVLSKAKAGYLFAEWRYTQEPGSPQEICTDGSLLSSEASDTVRLNSNLYMVAVFRECGAHTPGEPVRENEIPASCEKDGRYDSVTYCDACRKELSRETVAVSATGHDYGDWTQTAAPTCLAAGEETRRCSRCKDVDRRDVPARGHDFGDWTRTAEPTCLGKGTQTRVCARCGTLETGPVDALGHAWDAWEIVRSASPDAPGEKKHVCARCGTVETAQIDVLILCSSADGQSSSRLTVTVPYARRGAVATTLTADEEIILTSSDPKLLEVNADGSVTFTRLRLFRRSATVTAVSADGSRTATCTIQIELRWWHYILWLLLGFLWF